MNNTILVFKVALLLICCGGSKEITSKDVDLDETPERFNKLQTDTNYF